MSLIAFSRQPSAIRRSQIGFTLVELMVAIAILAVLATVGMVFYGQTNKTARNSRRAEDLKSISTALEAYKANVGRYPISASSVCLKTLNETLNPKLSPGYLREVPNDPSGDPYCYKYISINGADYKIITDPGLFDSGELGEVDLKKYADLMDPVKDASGKSKSLALFTNGCETGGCQAAPAQNPSLVTPSISPSCVSDQASCSATTPACGQTTTGTDNCGRPCSKNGDACPCTTAWSTCSGTCGGGAGTQTRTCPAGTIGATSQSCTNTTACPACTTAWSACSGACGGGAGTQTRSCPVGTVGATTQSCVNNTACPACTTAWGACSGACGGGTGTQTRTCPAGTTGATSQSCVNNTACPACTTAWSACSGHCNGGTGTQTRTCPAGTVGATSQSCTNTTACPAMYVQSSANCANQPETPDEICRSIPGYTRAAQSGTAGNGQPRYAKGYWHKQYAGAKIENCNGLDCTVSACDWSNCSDGFWSPQTYCAAEALSPSSSQYYGNGSTVNTFGSCGGIGCNNNPGYTVRVLCL